MDDFLTRTHLILITAGGALTIDQARAEAVKQLAAEAEEAHRKNGWRALVAPVFTLAVAFGGCAAQILQGAPQ